MCEGGKKGRGVFFCHCEDGSILGGAIIQGIYASADKGLGCVSVSVYVCVCVRAEGGSLIPQRLNLPRSDGNRWIHLGQRGRGGGGDGGGGGGWLERTRPGFSSDRDRGQTHNPNRGFLFKASWSGFITCRTFILGNLYFFVFFLSTISFVFLRFFSFFNFELFD